MAQRRMSGWTRDRRTIGAGLEPADVVHLQSEQVAEAMRQEGGRDTALHRFLRLDLQHARSVQQPGNQPVRGEMQLAPVDTGRHGFAEFLLQLVHAIHQSGKCAGTHGPGARDVAAITTAAGAGIDQQRQRTSRRLPVAMLVVQRGRMLIQPDDAGVGQFLIHLPHPCPGKRDGYRTRRGRREKHAPLRDVPPRPLLSPYADSRFHKQSCGIEPVQAARLFAVD